MALKLYGGKDINIPVEFMVRADNLAEAENLAALLQDELEVANFLAVDDFTGPIRLADPLKRDPFPTPSPINGGIVRPEDFPVLPVGSVYRALRMDGVDNSIAFVDTDGVNSITQNFQIVAWIEFLEYEGAGEQVIVSQWVVTEFVDERVFRLLVNGDKLEFDVSDDGVNTFTLSADIDAVHDQGFWVRASFTGVFGTATLTLFTSQQNRFVEPDDLTWIEEISRDVNFSVLSTSTPSDMTVGGQGVPNFDSINSPDGSIGRMVLYSGAASDLADNTVLNDMYPDRDYVGGGSWVSQTGESWILAGRASIGIPVVGGGILVFEFNGEEGNEITTGNSVLDSITGTITLAVWIEFIVYPVPGDLDLLGKDDGTIEGDSWLLGVAANDDALALLGDGANLDRIEGDAPLFVVGEGRWTAFTYAPLTKIIDFYTSDSAIDTDPGDIDWTLTDTAISNLPSPVLNATDVAITVGASGLGTDSPTAFIARALVISGNTAGTLFKEMYPDRDYNGGSQMTSLSTGEVWNLVGDIEIGYI